MAKCGNAGFDLAAMDALSLDTSGGAFLLTGMTWVIIQAAYTYMSDLENWCGEYGTGEEKLTDAEKFLIREFLSVLEADLANTI